jgi:purine-nucleoside phosphorylase
MIHSRPQAAVLCDPVAFTYRDLPHFPAVTAPGHAGRLVVGRLAGRTVMALQGRFHLYEGYSPLAVTFPIRVMQALGVGGLIITNASGGLNPGFRPGELMVIDDHINLTGASPLTGANEDRWGPRFPDMSQVYDPLMAAAARRTAAAAGIGCCAGVYAGLAGPSLETPAEVRYLRTIGADAVGFSTVLEAIAARHAGMRVAGLAIITNVHDPDRPTAARLEDIIAVANSAAPALSTVIAGIVAAF